MEGVFDFAPAIAVFLLVAFVIALAFGKHLPKKGRYRVSSRRGLLLLSALMLVAVSSGEVYHETLYEWAAGDATSATGVEGIAFTFGILIDPLAALMLVIVSLVAFLVHVFSLGYMNAEGETGLP